MGAKIHMYMPRIQICSTHATLISYLLALENLNNLTTSLHCISLNSKGPFEVVVPFTTK